MIDSDDVAATRAAGIIAAGGSPVLRLHKVNGLYARVEVSSTKEFEMGRKADALQEELDITEAELKVANDEIRRLRGMLDQVPASALACLTPSQNQAVSVGADTRTDLAPDEHPVVADARAAVAELFNPTPAPEKSESLLEVVQRNNWEREQLNTSQRAANALISRVASALQVPRWDADGTEILEKAQRFSVFVHFLSKRLKAAIGGPVGITDRALHPDDRDMAVNKAVIDELRTIISALVAPPAVSKFLHEKSPAKVTAGIFDTALDPGELAVGTINRADVLALRDAWAVYAAERNRPSGAVDWLLATAKSEVAITEFVELVNVLLVPTLNRLKLATR